MISTNVDKPFPVVLMMMSSNGNIFRFIVFLCDPWRGDLMCSLICANKRFRANNRDAGDLRRHLAHYDVTVMQPKYLYLCIANDLSWGNNGIELGRKVYGYVNMFLRFRDIFHGHNFLYMYIYKSYVHGLRSVMICEFGAVQRKNRDLVYRYMYTYVSISWLDSKNHLSQRSLS